MKKFTRAMLITAGVLGILGIGLSLGGVLMGATTESIHLFRTFHEMVEEETAIPTEKKENVKVYEMDQIQSISTELFSGQIFLEASDHPGFELKIENDKDNKITVQRENHELILTSEEKSVGHRKKGREILRLRYPRDTVFQELDLEMGAGAVVFKDDVKAEEFNLSIGAGKATGMGCITAGEAELSVGAGVAEIDRLQANDISAECAAGKLEMTLAGSQEDYCIEAEGGLHNITVGEHKESGIYGVHTWGHHNGSKRVELECAAGSIKIDFEEE